MRSNFKPIGNYVQQTNARNSGLSVTNLQGVSINKFFMPSVANINGTDLSIYKVVTREQFAFNPMHVGRDEVLPIAMLETDDPVIVSPAYVVFEIIDKQTLLPEYLMMWCRRHEFDRNAWFTTDSSVRGGFSWNDFCEMKLPVPSPEKQREIVKEYHTIVNRIKLNERLNQKLEETAQAIYKQWFVDFEFPISAEYAAEIGKPELKGLPYKSSGGEMVYNEVLKQEIPNGWGDATLDFVADIQAGGDKPQNVSVNKTDIYHVPIYANSTENEGLYGYTSEAKIFEKSITVSARGAIIGYTVLRLKPFVPIVRLITVIPKQQNLLNYLFQYIKSIKHDSLASAQGQLTIPDMSLLSIVKPLSGILSEYHKTSAILFENIESVKAQLSKLEELKAVLLSKMTKMVA
jgi:type I restriction enzyme, S subunit